MTSYLYSFLYPGFCLIYDVIEELGIKIKRLKRNIKLLEKDTIYLLPFLNDIFWVDFSSYPISSKLQRENCIAESVLLKCNL